MKKFLKLLFLCPVVIAVMLSATESKAFDEPASEEYASDVYIEEESATDEQISKSPFYHSDDKAISMYQNNNCYELYRTEIAIDFNNDGDCTVHDARELLRIAANVSEYTGDTECIDVIVDGKITPADARFLLRYAAKLDVCYTTADMTSPTGFMTDDKNNTYYMECGGVFASGLKNIDGKLYFFETDKKMATGLKKIYGENYYFGSDGKGIGGKINADGVEYFFSDSGKSYSGDYTENGKTYYYVNGVKYTGWYKDGTTERYYKTDGAMATGKTTVDGAEYFFTDNGERYSGNYTENGKTYYYVNGVKYTGWYKDGNSYRYYKTDGSMATGKTTIDGVAYNFGTDGKMQNGFVTAGGKTYYYNNGVALTGKQTIDGNIYYFYNDGHMAKNEVVKGIYYNNKGIATKADKSFFDDAVFIGDSVSVKLASYQKSTAALGKAQVYAASSLSAANALWKVSSKSVHPKYNGKKTLVEDCVKNSKAKKVFIMLGMNDIGIYSFDKSVSNYKDLVARIKSKSPDVEIYIQSMTPLTSTSARADSKLNNTNIKKYNARLKQMCEEMGWHYIDVASALYDSTGSYLPSQYCSDPVNMGMHMTNKGCEKWVEYLMNNVPFV